MKQVKYYNRLIIDSNYDRVFLFHESELKEVAYNNEAYDYAPCYRVNDSGYMERAEDILTEDDFKDLYYRADENDKAEDIEYYETLYDDELQPFVRANWDNHEHYFLLSLEHGINTTEYDFVESSVEIIEGTCYLASEHIDQEYPETNYQDFYKFVSSEGKEYYIKRACPFYSDESDDAFELITEDEFYEYD